MSIHTEGWKTYFLVNERFFSASLVSDGILHSTLSYIFEQEVWQLSRLHLIKWAAVHESLCQIKHVAISGARRPFAVLTTEHTRHQPSTLDVYAAVEEKFHRTPQKNNKKVPPGMCLCWLFPALSTDHWAILSLCYSSNIAYMTLIITFQSPANHKPSLSKYKH